MSRENDTTRRSYVHPADPAGWLRPDEPYIVDGLDWSWAFVVYRPVLGFSGYCVGSNATAWTCIVRLRTGTKARVFGPGPIWRRMKASIRCGYMVVNLHREKKGYVKFVHRLVLEAFDGPCPPGKECRHIDDVRLNSNYFNIIWGTRLENMADRARNGILNLGQDVYSTKLTDDQVRELRSEYSSGASVADLAKRLGISKQHAYLIIKRQRRAHV